MFLLAWARWRNHFGSMVAVNFLFFAVDFNVHVSFSWRVLSALQDLNLYIVYFENLYTWFGFNFQVFPSLFEQMIFIKLQLIGMNLIGMFFFGGSNSTTDLACEVVFFPTQDAVVTTRMT